MKTDRADAARDLMKRALTSVPKQRRRFSSIPSGISFEFSIDSSDVPLISRFAQMEFRNGDVERGRTLFESLVSPRYSLSSVPMSSMPIR